jgi:hypothetical protein
MHERLAGRYDYTPYVDLERGDAQHERCERAAGSR